jgi:hypothetical protein
VRELALMRASRHAPNGLVHRCHDCPIHDAVHVLNLHRSNALADDRYAVLHRGHSDDHLCVTELDRRDVAHRFADALDDHRNCVDDHHHDADDLDANRDHRNDHQTKDDLNSDDLMTDDHDRLDDHHHCVDVTDDLDDHRIDRVLVDGHHHDADATDDRNQNCVRDLDDHHRHVDDLDANRDRQTCHLLKDDQMMDDPNLGVLMTDGRDRLDGHRHFVDVTGDRNQNCAGDLDGHHCCADVTGDHLRCAGDLDGHHRDVDGKVVNRHDEGLWLQRHLGELDGLNHYLVLGDADRFCLV